MLKPRKRQTLGLMLAETWRLIYDLTSGTRRLVKYYTSGPRRQITSYLIISLTIKPRSNSTHFQKKIFSPSTRNSRQMAPYSARFSTHCILNKLFLLNVCLRMVCLQVATDFADPTVNRKLNRVTEFNLSRNPGWNFCLVCNDITVVYWQ